MHLDLTEILTCPECGPPNGLIVFVDRMQDRRILDGRLDCPICERRHPILRGIVYLGADPTGGPESGSPPDGPPERRSAPSPEAAGTAAALLGPPEGPELLLLTAGAEGMAEGIASLRPEATILAIGHAAASRRAAARVHAPGSSGRRVHRLVLGEVARRHGLPLRPGRLDGAVLAGPATPPAVLPTLIEEVAAVLRPGARLVVLAPGDALAEFRHERLRLLAADERAWVAVRA